ncbi:VWA domain-containing protein [Flammeovirga yaeyamensis]|uniref:VWA domain-containing protein n=1 Tax=Flammeovirga yaeyamensis TaxID=367791 RepID=A0AAX1N5W9_9BACT|nr:MULTISPECIES: VWA domain-containing protein [Flammeovirga]ANQ49672.2 VWA domain-containing protein [Flammeovirga sp. MY04]MBB3697469.1 Ca-activated chloride channel family protein [Flammeovirga yaeyamensis]NMF36163.1 VWA domain-containing protein [Flammeovirga yaeyamensis]QWG02896.1 VWA domain-containing protein [Flammeovirga yaeyamensis]
MSLTRSLGIVELSLIGVFILFYGFYLLRIINARKSFRAKGGATLYKLILRTVYFSLFIISLLGPTFGEMKKEVKAVSKDIYICVDLSKSMDAIDVKPSRLAKLKFELKQIVKSFNSDRLGLIVFTSDAFLQCPLTYDGNALNMFIETMSTSLISNTGTDFGPPLEMAIQKLMDADEGLPTAKQASKIIILISDGEDYGKDTGSAISQIKDQNVKLFTMGIGTKSGSKIPAGYRFKRDKMGNDVVTKLNSESLIDLANSTGGSYFEISDERNDINRLISSIGNIQGELKSSKMADVGANKFYYFLMAGLLLLGLDVMLAVRVIKI